MEPDYFRDIDRRTFIGRLVTFLCTSAGANVLLSAMPFQAFAIQKQSDWRFCQNCNALFYGGRKDKGHCPAGSGHVAAGYNFYMMVGGVGEEIPPGQTYWRECQKCYAMFYGGYKGKGTCPANGSHVMRNELYTLEHDRGASSGEQRDWRFCNKCYVLFFDGFPNKGRCPAGNGHFAQGYNFVLRWGVRID